MPDSDEILAALVKKAEAGELPREVAGMLEHLPGTIASGLPITEMQADLLEDLSQEYRL